MDIVFTAQTNHGTVLAIDVTDRRVRHVAQGELNHQVVPVCFLTGGTLGARCVPFGIEGLQTQPILPREISPGAGLVLHIGQGDEAGTLRSLVTNRFLSAVPDGGLEADRATPAPWERFTFNPVTALQTGIAPAIDHFIARARATLAPSISWSDSITMLLASGASYPNADLIEAIWPLLTLEEFDRLASRLRQDRALSGRLLEIFQSDFYATRALPALLTWLAAREPQHDPAPTNPGGGAWPTRHTAAPTPWRWQGPDAAAGQQRPALRTIGPEFDHLARDGYDGRLSSFPHACNAALRLRTTPTKGTAIVATARSEGVYLLEWIAHHRLLGVEAIFLYTNDNDDGSDALLAALHTAGVITWTRSELAAGTSAQNKAYGHALNVNLPLLDYRWALFIDLDEFLVLNPERYRGIADFGRWHEMRQTDAVGINWVMVGSSGQLQWSDEPLTRRNTHLLNQSNAHIKVMLAPRQFIQAHPHFPFADRRRSYTFRLANGELHEHRKQPPGKYHARAFTDEPSSADACLYHYNFKSVEEFAWKVSRNRGDFPMSHDINFDALDHVAVGSFMLQHHSTDVTQNDRLARSAPGLESELQRLRDLPDVAATERAVISRFRERLGLVKSKLLADPRLSHLGEAGQQMRTLLQATLG